MKFEKLTAITVSIGTAGEDLTCVVADVNSFRSEALQSQHTLRQQMKRHYDDLERMITGRNQRSEQLIRALAEKLEVAIDIRERLAAMEARLRQQ